MSTFYKIPIEAVGNAAGIVLPSDLLAALPNLVKLDLSRNRLTSLDGLNLGQLSGLRELDLSHNPLCDVPLATLTGTGLTRLNLSHNRLGRLAFAELPYLGNSQEITHPQSVP